MNDRRQSKSAPVALRTDAAAGGRTRHDANQRLPAMLKKTHRRRQPANRGRNNRRTPPMNDPSPVDARSTALRVTFAARVFDRLSPIQMGRPLPSLTSPTPPHMPYQHREGETERRANGQAHIQRLDAFGHSAKNDLVRKAYDFYVFTSQ